MRLINVTTLELEEFFGTKTPPYAILSHAWGDQEVTFQEWKHRSHPSIKGKAGYTKIVGACRCAHADKLQYLWCDTNCIDKTSSAELTEAINSMFAWYHDSQVCYAYLSDVDTKEALPKSRWWTRGWTLQEFLAPRTVVFFNRHWKMLGDKSGSARLMSGITRIHVEALKNRETVQNYSIAQRMSWAAGRQTSRTEDIAYCLLGIFDINMPLLYGEGPKAFVRLQKELIKVSTDQSILAWDLQDPGAHISTNALALSPDAFRFCGSIVKSDEIHHAPYSITNLGISMELALFKTLAEGIVLVGLNCVKELYREALHPGQSDRTKLRRHFQIWIPLRHLQHGNYARVHHPSSKLFLEKSYPTLGYPTQTNLFLSLDVSQPPTILPRSSHVEFVRRHSSSLPSGILISVAAGQVMPNTDLLKEAYPLGDMSIVQLKGQAPSSVSHQLISNGKLSIIFSVFWNNGGLPQEWSHTVIFDPGFTISSKMASQKEWGCLFETSGHGKSDQCCNDAASLHSLHGRLHHSYGKLLAAYTKGSKDPLIVVEDQPLKDLFGHPELIVDIIFRES
ncbi:HET-domain-containing protein [Hypoxylon sp. FL1150]|nr:HET-domain-containing protein [Hypoxylon sp. FL1150]